VMMSAHSTKNWMRSERQPLPKVAYIKLADRVKVQNSSAS
jgi:hypothetical protein